MAEVTARLLETVLTGRNLLSPVLTTAAADVERYDAKVTAANEQAGRSAAASAQVQESSAAKVTASNARTAESSTATSAKVVAANSRAAESSRVFADITESSAARTGVAWARVATVGIPVVGAAIAVVTGKMAGDFQQLTTKLETTAGESHKNLAMVSQGMLDMAGKVGISATELAKGMYTVESAGYHGAAGLNVLKASAQGARQENADLGKVADAVSTILHDYHLPASQAATVTSELVTAVAHGKTTFDELTGSLHSVTPLASVLGVSIADVTGTLSAMTASGMSADQATQNMADTLRHLANPTNTMTAELAQLGITSSDLADDLSSKGLAGTLQLVESAIVNHLDPATRRVLLPALNQSKTAVADMNQMMAAMPPSLAKASQSLLDGKTSIKDYQMAAKDMGGQSGAMALQFLSLMKSSDGFNSALKSGSPAAQAFTAAMAKSFGTASALNVALMTTGENAKATNAAVKDIGKSSADASGNIKGWGEVQGNFNQKLAQAGAEAKSLAIEAGQHLLPVLTSIVSWVASDGLPGIQHLGAGIGDLIHDFEQLPGPVKVVIEVMAGLAVANKLGIFTRLGSEVQFAGGMLQSFATMTKSSMGQVSAAFAEAKASSAFIQTLDGGVANRFTGSLAGMGAAAGTAAKGGLSALRSGVGGLVGMLGGPWVVGIGAAIGAVLLWKKGIDDHNAAVKADTEQVKSWYKAMSEGGQGAVDASQKLKDKQRELADAQAVLAKQEEAANARRGAAGRVSGAVTAGLEVERQKVSDLTGEVKKGKKEWDDYWKSLTPQGKIAQIVAGDEADLALAIQRHGAGSREVNAASVQYNADLEKQKQLSVALTGAEQTQIDKLNQLASSQLAGVSSTLAATQAQSQLSDAIGQYNTDAHDGQHSTKQLADESNSLAQQAISTAQAIGKATADQLAANGVTDDGTAANAAILKSLKDAASHITGPGHDALMLAIKDMGKTAVAAGDVHDAVDKMGVHIDKTWNDSTVIVGAMTAQQITDLHNLGYATKTLPNGKIVVTSDTQPAKDEINKMLADYGHRALNLQAFIAGNSSVNGALQGNVGAQRGMATGGLFRGAGTSTSDSNLIAVSDNEFIVNAAATQANLTLLHAINSGAIKGFAAGGLASGNTMTVGTDTIPTHMDTTGVGNQLAALIAHLRAAMSFTGGGGGAGSPAIRALGQQIAASMGYGGQFGAIDYIFSHESGWNPQAQNPTSTAYGIPQFLAATWAQYGGKTPYAGQQIHKGIEYMDDRYGSPNAAAAFWRSHHWYKDGTNYVPSDQLAVLHRGEAVVPASRNQGTPYAPTAMPGYGMGGGFRGTVAVAAPHVTVEARVFIGDREITDIVRVESRTVVDGRLEDLYRKKKYL